MDSTEKPSLRPINVDPPIQEFIDAIKRDGGCICMNYVTPEEIAQANAEVKPFLDADKPWQICIPPVSSILLRTAMAGQTAPSRDSTL
jgi:hypothetical protein